MTYDPVAQADREVLSDGSNSVASGSPPANSPFRPISMGFEDLGGNLTTEVDQANESADTRLASLMRSMASTGTSYDMLEDDDYEETPVQNNSTQLDLDPTVIRSQPLSSSLSGSGRIRTASIGPKLPLRHPTPDLQSVQGAYIKNVEHLEESAERLSVTSRPEENLHETKLEQQREQTHSSAAVGNAPSIQHISRQVSAASLSNPVTEINVSAMPAGRVPSHQAVSPKSSMLFGSWSQASHPVPPTSQTPSLIQPMPDPGFGLTSPSNARQNTSSSFRPPIPPPHTYQPGKHVRQVSVEQSQTQNVGDAEEVRPSTSASNDTYRQATTLFVDFDGVHYTSHSHLSPSRQVSTSRQVAINQPPLAADARAFDEPPAAEGMVYYPAPVPMMLNLPQKLSKQPSPAERERRRLKALSTMPNEMRKSAAWLNEMEKTTSADGTRTSQALSNLPPQLRASAFFDHPGLGQDIDIKSASAVDTLDSILDASAHAPVSAFTDHPFAGHLGGEVYGAQNGHRKSAILERKKKRRSSITNLLRTSTGLTSDTKIPRPSSPTGISVMPKNKLTRRRSKLEVNEAEAALANGEDKPLRASGDFENAVEETNKPSADDLEADKAGDESEKEDEEDEDYEVEEPDAIAYSGPPTTLLAELQMRKAQQRLRNRTAANAFPNGMHSTLLELDAVAQVQQKSRKKKHITLAWEDHEVGDPADFDDEDVPLGILAAGQKMQQNLNRPMGLMEKREMEDNEPLSRRRARLRGDDMNRTASGPSEQQRASTMYTLEPPALTDKVLEEQEGETLAQRIQRLKAEKENATGLSTDFTKDTSSQLGPKMENVPPATETPDAEETLGQRRKRLREEALKIKNSRQPSGASSQNLLGVKARSSMADILSQHPAAGARKPSNDTKGLAQQTSLPQLSAQYDSQMNHLPTFQQPMMNPYMLPGATAYTSFNGGMPYMNGTAGFNYNNPMMYSPGLAMQMGGYGHNAYMQDPIMMGPPLDPKQRDMIDRWRQGVAP